MPTEADEWDDPRFVFKVISCVLSYLSTMIPDIVGEYIEYKEVFEKLREIRAILGQCLDFNFPFIDVITDELKGYSRVHIETMFHS